MEDDKRLQREAFNERILEFALADKNVFFLTADFGSATLEKKFVPQLPEQFLHTGIAEQAMVNIATGLALDGKKPYTYAMDCFITPRAYEQVKIASASFQNSRTPKFMTIVGVGGGFSYSDAGPTHYTTEVISAMRAIANIEILSPADNLAVIEAAKLSYSKPGLKYIRLDRQNLPQVHNEASITEMQAKGFAEIIPGEDMCFVTTGYTTHKAVQASKALSEKGISAGVIDVFRLEPFNGVGLCKALEGYKKIVSWEEHFLNGGLGSIVAESIADNNLLKPLKRIGVPAKYYFENDSENGGRAYIHNLAAIDLENVVTQTERFHKK
ncbi:MAG: transketolase C-terminal domain-containing protein [Nanoarchaeota archaeon]|nr:transketolase C-terminal domain-containing protein [Nanoarchaeota archaeon]